LAYFDKNAKTQIIADVSPVGIAAILVQSKNGDSQIVSYARRSLI
jgi:hypothetical protein